MTGEDELRPIIGLEIHTQLDTETKLFCSCPIVEDAEPNNSVCPVCLGLPGSLPQLNEEVLEKAIIASKAIDGDVSEKISFDRKHYFYPDLPKGFQITQYQEPIIKNGFIKIEGKEIEFRRAHIEEDPGSLSYDGDITDSSKTKADYNRSGVPLIEFVTEPDIKSPSEAREFVETLIRRLDFVGVVDQQKSGSVRVDANISVNKTGDLDSTRVEIKNIGSPTEVEDALLYEITRQKNRIRRGKELKQTTRHWDESKGVTTELRSKETEKDYRYMREYDLPKYKIGKFS